MVKPPEAYMLSRKRIAGLVSILILIVCQPLILHAEKAGWPVGVGDDNIYSSPTLADIDGDGKLEVIVQSSGVKKGGNGVLYVWRYDGTLYPGWPQTATGAIQHTNSVAGNVDPNYEGMEIVSCTIQGKVYLWHKDGTLADGWPKTLPGAAYAPVIADLDGDGRLEIIVSCADKKIYVYNGSGNSLSGWPQSTGEPASIAAVRDINSDGKIEVLARDTQKIYLWDAKGQVMPGWPKDGAGRDGGSAVGDIDPKYKGLEIVCVMPDKINILHSDGTAVAGWPKVLPAPGPPAIGDIDEDGLLEVVVGSDPGKEATPLMYAFRADGSIVSGWPVEISGTRGYGLAGAPVLVDLNGDGKLEIVVGSPCYSIHAWRYDGNRVKNFPIENIGMQFYSPVIADLDDNGRLEIVFCDISTKVHVVELPFSYK